MHFACLNPNEASWLVAAYFIPRASVVAVKRPQKTKKMPRCVIINCNSPKISSIQTQEHISYHRNKADAKSRQVLNKSNLAGLRTSPQVPQLPRSPQSPVSSQPPQQRPHKVNRTRSSSASLTTPAVSTRKRTSSGVFHVDSSEPVAKKSISPTQPETTTNGRNKTDTGDTGNKDDDSVRKKDATEKKKPGSEKKKDKADRKKDSVEKQDKIVEKFDSKAMSNCVTAFKESDSWD